jgi:hypothetical protein
MHVEGVVADLGFRRLEVLEQIEVGTPFSSTTTVEDYLGEWLRPAPADSADRPRKL